MKTLVTLAAAAALAALGGCATYADPYGYGYSNGVSATAVYQSGPGYGYGGYPAYPAYQGVPAGRRDRDLDGIPNQMDRDRDGDGIPNEYDRRPNNPSRR